ncbi:lysylphosphatidylglycerol synthase domain-containing protein [Neolewinella antarctica]|uniref:Uncharacterized protein n=1 Tax=Neolewinella antarctica TaxID=442734 RepID=A0ABX0XG65_9BACT|nr:lysylphosphatidylglycerol synthase domain-containing protein [Neolewinella antarctica]NJC27904.1 hypothetical protein [Neolewinella antarctica]
MTKEGNKLFGSVWKIWALRLLGAALVLAFAWHLYRLTRELDWSDFGRSLTRSDRWPYFLFVLALMPLNWWLEARKWHPLLSAFLTWPFSKTWRATIAGVTLSAATPNRIGEIGGRMTVATKEEWPAVIASSILGSACQWIAFLLLAWPGLMWTAGELLQDRINFPVTWLWPVGPVLLLAGIWLGKPAFVGLLKFLNGKWGYDTTQLSYGLEKVNAGLMIRAGAYACVRFSVYCGQLYLLLRFFGLALPVGKTLAGIAGIYLVQAGIPLPPGANLVTRTELGLLLWGDGPEVAAATVLAFATLFIVNVLLPSLPGYWLIVQKHK